MKHIAINSKLSVFIVQIVSLWLWSCVEFIGMELFAGLPPAVIHCTLKFLVEKLHTLSLPMSLNYPFQLQGEIFRFMPLYFGESRGHLPFGRECWCLQLFSLECVWDIKWSSSTKCNLMNSIVFIRITSKMREASVSSILKSWMRLKVIEKKIHSWWSKFPTTLLGSLMFMTRVLRKYLILISPKNLM